MKKINILSLVFAFLAMACGTSKEEANQKEEKIPVVKTIEVVKRPYIPTLSYAGTVFANKEANLGATLPGKVERIFFAEGQSVKKGALIVELSDEMLTQAEIEYETIKKDYERIQRLRDKGSVSEMEYDHVRAKYEASLAKTQMVRKNTQVHAPFSGIIAEHMMEEGEVYFLNPGFEPGYSMRSGIVRLMQLDPVRVEFEVNEKELSEIQKGSEAQITLDAISGETFAGVISRIKPMLNTISRTATVEVLLKNRRNNLKPGMYANVVVRSEEQEGVFVPLRAIGRIQGTAEEYVMVVENNIVRKVTIHRKANQGEEAVVTGIQAGMMVILEGKNKVNDGDSVKVRV
jgi:membrane fusion protein (multidrug efflux system)